MERYNILTIQQIADLVDRRWDSYKEPGEHKEFIHKQVIRYKVDEHGRGWYIEAPKSLDQEREYNEIKLFQEELITLRLLQEKLSTVFHGADSAREKSQREAEIKNQIDLLWKKLFPKNMVTKHRPSGLKSKLDTSEIKRFYKGLTKKDQKFIEGNEDNFIAALTHQETPLYFKKIKWIYMYRGRPNQNTFWAFLEVCGQKTDTGVYDVFNIPKLSSPNRDDLSYARWRSKFRIMISEK
jgi:hypothetical protein